jgi:hypothetical protein
MMKQRLIARRTVESSIATFAEHKRDSVKVNPAALQ